ncbi:MAG: hypothetical protein ABI645_07920 [Pseudomonadota bacterium]
MFVVMMAAMAANLGSCKAEDAHYQQRSEPSITATFLPMERTRDWPSGLAVKMHFRESGRTYWWLPWNGGTDGQRHLASTTDVTAPGWKMLSPDDGSQRPLGDVSYIGMDAKYNVIQGVPRRGEIAPAHFHVPDLRVALWYRTPPDKRDADSGQFFDLVSCSSSTKEKAR